MNAYEIIGHIVAWLAIACGAVVAIGILLAAAVIAARFHWKLRQWAAYATIYRATGMSRATVKDMSKALNYAIPRGGDARKHVLDFIELVKKNRANVEESRQEALGEGRG